jgi:hypothetical protein
MGGRTYQQLIGDVLFWHSVLFDELGFAKGIKRPFTMESLRGRSQVSKLVAVRRDVARMLHERERDRNKRGYRVFSMTRIGRILNRHHTTILVYLNGKKYRPWVPRHLRRFEIPREKSQVEQLTI